MASDVTPDAIRTADFRTTFRGFQPAEVHALLEVAAQRIESLEAEYRKLKAQAAETIRPDLEREFDSVGREVSTILQTAREAAESMRERAGLDAERWRGEAQEEAATARREAEADAEALRRDAWVAGTEILEQAQSAAEAMRAEAERDVLTVMGEAEREAHRLSSGARREAEDLVRGANMEAERIGTLATTRRDEIIDGANRQAATAQERTRALETRREELLEELENVRSTLTRLEGSLEERREALETAALEPTSVKVVHPPAEAKKQWELGETVRVVRPDGELEPDSVSAEDVRDEVARMQEPESAGADPAPEQPHRSEPGAEPPPEPEAELIPEPGAETASEPAPGPPAPETSEAVGVMPEAEAEDAPEHQTSRPEVPGPGALEPTAPELGEGVGEPGTREPDLDALFAALRSSPEAAPSGEEDSVEAPSATDDHLDDSVDEPAAEGDGTDWMALRDSRLLPITNRALRGVKKAMTEMQNVALDGLRTDGELRLEPASIADAVHADLVAVWSESFAAGHAAAVQMTGDKLTRPNTPMLEEDGRFADDMVEAVGRAISQVGEGSRERQSAVSRVFRVWRSDEAERRLRDIALLGYETGIEMSRNGPAG